MVVGIRDAAKMAGIMIVSGCAVFVCTLFLNFNMDIVSIREEITSSQVMMFYDAQVSIAKMVSSLSGGCLLATSIVMLAFYIKHYIDTHGKELGILKALGYSRLAVAGHFWVFGIGIFLGTLIGFGGAWFLMPRFYEVQNKEKILPEIALHFHWELLVSLVAIPTLTFSIISILYAYLKLNKPVLELIRENWQVNRKKKRHGQKQSRNRERTFLEEMRRGILREKKALVFFILFASFCFSSMTQMSFSMDELASEMMGMMIMGIGIILACTTLFLAITTVVNGNRKTIAMMRVFGYSRKQCSSALLGGYRPVGYAGFAIGTIYQYVLLKIAVSVFFKDIAGVPDYQFDFPGMMVSLGAFVFIYEVIMFSYSEKIKSVSVKEIMLE